MVINLARNLMTKIPIIKRGTYYCPDPTAYKLGSITHDNVDIQMSDNTWSVSFHFRKNGKNLADILYFPSIGGSEPYILTEGMPKHFLTFLHKLSSGMKRVPTEEEEYFDDPMGNPSDYY